MSACKSYVDPLQTVKVLDRRPLQIFLTGEAVGETTNNDAKEMMMSSSNEPKKHRERDGDHHKSSSSSSRHKSSSSSSRDRDRRKSSSSSKHAHRDRSSSASASHKKKPSERITSEKVLANLTSVADKRGQQQAQPALIKSLKKTSATTGADDGKTNAAAAAAAYGEDTVDGAAAGTEVDFSFLSADGFDLPDIAVMEDDRKVVAKITAFEIAVGDSASVLRAWDARSLKRVLDLYNDHKKMESSSAYRKRGSKSMSSSAILAPHEQAKKKKKRPTKPPVIIVPNAVTSPVTLINSEEFFKRSKYVPSDVMKKNGARKQPTVTIRRSIASKFGGKEMEYEIIDNPKGRLGTNKYEWDRVVAVVAQGAEWQFKGWLWSNPVQIFSKTFGFYVGMDGDPVPKGLASWNVKLGKLNRDKRGLDSVTHASFWNNLDEWMYINKPEYLPDPEM